ncbi:MAG: head GIN domain-containing protein [Bacteroidota bacterium]
MRKFIVILFVIPIFISLSCQDDSNPASTNTINGSGTLITTAPSLPAFNSVIMAAFGTVEITMGASQAVSITVDDNILEHLEYEVDHGILTISPMPDANISNYDLTVELAMTDLESVTLSGIGNIISTNAIEESSVEANLTGIGNIILTLNVDQFNSILTGIGNVIPSGTAARHHCIHSGTGNMSGFDLITDTTSIILSGTGNSQVYVSDYLSINLTGTGSVYYKGRPSMNIVVTGIGNIIDAN